MQSIKILFIQIISLCLPFFVHAQNGFIRGAVFDDATGEYLPGVTILVEGTTIGTITDLDGRFNLAIASGTYDLRLSFISYQTLNVSGVEVKAGEVTLLESLRLKEVTLELTGVTISAQAVRNTEASLLTIRKKSANVIDGISSVSFRKIGDSDAASSIKRVPGVSVEGGKYVYIRGLGDRYTKTILNGMDIPGLDPDRNTLQMDIFPTNVIDNIIVHKSFTAELPADFTGGVIDIAIKDFPEERKGSASLSLGYNPDFHFTSDYLDYQGGETDFLGFDDGTRDIPATENIPFYSEVVGNPYGEKGLRYREILETFNPAMAAQKRTSFMDYNATFSIGNQSAGEKTTLGYNFAISYKGYSEFYRDAEYGRYGLAGDASVYEMEVREFQMGDYGVNGVLWSGLVGIALKTQYSKFRINLLHLQNGESRAGIFDYESTDQGSNFEGFQHNLEYSERAMTNLLVDGRHTFKGSRWSVEWKLSPTRSAMKEPDTRFTRYIERGTYLVIGTESGFPERIWRNLEEINLAGVLHITREFQFIGQKSELLFGGSYTYKERDFIIRSYALNIRSVPLTGNPDELFFPENLWPLDGNVGKGTTYEARFVPTNPNQFNSNTKNAAGCISLELSPLKNLKTILGVRFENYVQRYTGQDQLGYNVLDNDKVLDNTDFFPSVNLIYALTDKQNLRFSYARTIARPSFKELSYAEIYDPISGRTFVGGLFRDANDVAGIEYWDGNLVSTDINNFDLRWEIFQANGQMVSVSGFYKIFNNPIEIVQYATQSGSFQPRNVGDGEVFGAELEFRLNSESIIPSIRNVTLSSNLTYTRSRIRMSKTEYDARVENARTGQTIDEYRDMAGQSPFIINCGLSYNGAETGFWDGFEAGLFYNVQGTTLQFIGMVDRPDIYTTPFHSLNFNMNKIFGKNDQFQVGLKFENLLNDEKESVFSSYKAYDQYYTRLHPGTSAQLRVAVKVF
jgi:hypothetical protein